MISILEISEATGVPGTTIRRYIQTFKTVLPEGEKFGRTRKYPAEIKEMIGFIHQWYQDGLSTVEIDHKLSNNDITTLPPQNHSIKNQSSFQEDIRELTKAIQELTKAITTMPPLNHNISIDTTTTPPDNHEPTVPEKNPREKKESVTPPSKYPNNQHDLPLGDAGQEENLDSPDLEDEPDFSGPGEAPAPEPKKTQPGATAFKKPEPVKEMDTSEAKIKKFNKDEISKIIVRLRDDQESKPSFQAIADKLHDMGYRSKKKGSRFHHSTVQNYYEYGKKL